MRAELDWSREWIVNNVADTAVLRARGVRKEYGKGEGLVRAVDGVNLEVDPGETVAVMGPSGCGKSTLLHLLGGLDRPSGGEVSLAGRRLDQMGEKALARMRRTAIGFVFQAFETLHEAGQTLVIVTHDERIAATADRLISMRDGAFVDETRLTGGTTGQLGALVGLEG